MTRLALGLLLACAAQAQLPHIGHINFYGLHQFTADQILAVAHIAPGDPLPASRIALEDRIIGIPDVMDAQVQSVCCEDGRTTLFIGVHERGQAEPDFRVPPSGTAVLPEEVMTRYRKYSGAEMRVEVNGANSSSEPAIRRDREFFRAYEAAHLVKLRAVLRTATDPEQRAAAVTVLACASNQKTILDDLLFALQDPDEDVRAHAIRELAAIARAARREPSPGLRIPPAALVDLLNSVALSDRVEATRALLALTERPNAAAIDQIRERALPSLVEMARWQTRSYAEPPFQLLGRVAGLNDADVIESWEHGDPEQIIRQAMDSAARKPGLQ